MKVGATISLKLDGTDERYLDFHLVAHPRQEAVPDLLNVFHGVAFRWN